MTILHIVLPKIHPEADPAAVSEICNDILGLGQKCVKPTGERYIKSVSGGKDNSVESLGGGATHAFIFEFENADDRSYYMTTDPAHMEVMTKLRAAGASGKVLTGMQVVDYTPGEF